MRRWLTLIVTLLVALAIAAALYRVGANVPERAVLVLELGGEIEEIPTSDLASRLFARGPALATLVLQLDKAVADERVVGVVAHLRPLEVGFARLQELRDAFARVRNAGKPVVALIDVASLNATRELYLASAAERVYVVPGAMSPLAGVVGEVFSLGGLLAKGGIEVEYERIGVYKTAPETFAERAMSDVARKATDELLDGIFTQIVNGIADGRGLEPAAVRALVDQAPATAKELVAADLADGIAERSELLELAEFTGAEELAVEDYAGVAPGEVGLRSGPRIALVFGDGAIVQGDARGPVTRGFSADVVSQALEDAAEDEGIRAIVLRVNSPGGSPLASDQVWRAVRAARKHKPVVASMADAAASGGYYVASAADAIVAEPATITGSIGVFLQRFSLAGLYQKLDVTTDVFARGRLAGIGASSEPLAPEERERIRELIAASYDDFLARVSTGRGLPRDAIDAVGQGRVFLGEAAREARLVDEIGGLDAAVARAKREAGIDPEVDPERVVFPGPRTLSDQVHDLLRGEVARELLGAWLHQTLPARRLDAVLQAWLAARPNEIALLPTWWVDIR
jgi:protease-4